jgi:hypothetical protein
MVPNSATILRINKLTYTYACVYICAYLYIHIYICTHICMYTYITHVYNEIRTVVGAGCVGWKMVNLYYFNYNYNYTLKIQSYLRCL